ncbi:hypothetical protein BGZ96_004353 [Linnemannia gamsii]|uniref:Uncharacterized protein n=1 Tax=Linnemannia gamsii TaxID=64522 RepID=A0ABQ7JI86_9FUNG|nr:hypothetical protein BGZ96_004353 [Linnemannia gamsii]
MRVSLTCLLAAVLPAAILGASQESFCEEKVSHRSRLFGRPAYYDLEEKAPGWVFFEENSIRARIHGNTYWNLRGKLEEKFPVDDFLFDPLTFTFNYPKDFEGPFKGHIGRGEFLLKWEKSDASIRGRAPIGDFSVTGETHVNYSP